MNEGDLFGPYRLQRLIGRGSAGEVFEAVDVPHVRTVALRVLPPVGADDGFSARFRREAALAAQLTEPHVVPVHDFGEIDGRLYIDMRWVPGVDLSTHLARTGRFPVRSAVEIVAQVAAALDAAHAVGLLHGALDPGDVLICGGPGTEFAYLADLGIARRTRAAPTSPTATGLAVAGLGYVAPESISGRVADHRADVYALGCLLYEVLVGHRPFPVENMAALLHAHLNEPPPRPSERVPGLPRVLDEVVARALAKDPDARYPSCGALAAAARLAVARPTSERAGPTWELGPPPGSPPATGTGDGGRRRRPRRRTGLVVSAVIAAVLTAAGGVLLARASTADPDEVLIEPVHSRGEHPFVSAAVDPDLDVVAPAGVGGPFAGDTPGLFGGSLGAPSCDPDRMVTMLDDDPEKAEVWAEVQGVRVGQVPGYVLGLTAVVLRSDTAATSHRFGDDRDAAVQVVLQAGTGVLVDEFGVPRAKCGSGNPLAPSRSPAGPRYPSTAWVGFSPSAVTTIQPAREAIREFTVVDPRTGAVFRRTRGSNGNRDR